MSNSDKKPKEYKTIERYCIDCGSVLNLPIPKKEGSKLIYCCVVCSLPYNVKFIQRNKRYRYILKLSISTEFNFYESEF